MTDAHSPGAHGPHAGTPTGVAFHRAARDEKLTWHRATDDPDAESCLEIAVGHDGMVRIRSSNRPEVVAVTTPAKWEAFVRGVKAGEFDHFAT